MPNSAGGVEHDLSIAVNTTDLNFTGHPAVNVPLGHDQYGVPFGLQIVAPRFRRRAGPRVGRGAGAGAAVGHGGPGLRALPDALAARGEVRGRMSVRRDTNSSAPVNNFALTWPPASGPGRRSQALAAASCLATSPQRPRASGSRCHIAWAW